MTSKSRKRENDLVGASFGRGFFVLDDFTPLRHVSSDLFKKEAHIFPVKKALSYIQLRPLELEGKAYMGDGYYLAENPPFGAIFTYYLKEDLKTAKQKRRATEKKLAKEGKSVPFPGWEEIRKQEREEDPTIVFTVKDQSGQVVRQVTGPVTKGIHRVAWDLRYPPVSPTKLVDPIDPNPWELPPKGPMVVPGTFTVSIAKQVDGVLTPMGNSQSFTVESLGLGTLEAKDKKATACVPGKSR